MKGFASCFKAFDVHMLREMLHNPLNLQVDLVYLSIRLL